TGVGCDAQDHTCSALYEIRYVGLVAGISDPPALVPAGFIVGWDGDLGDIPSGWSRATDYDGQFVRGATGTTSGATGGAQTHSHTTPGHTHTIGQHSHTLPASTGTTDLPQSTRRTTTQSTRGIRGHSHPLPPSTNASPGGPSGIATPGTSTANHEPLNYTVAWIASDGAPTSIPSGALVWGTTEITGYPAADASLLGHYLKGAPASNPGGAMAGSDRHTHTVNAHSHAGLGTHTHTAQNTGLQGTI